MALREARSVNLYKIILLVGVIVLLLFIAQGVFRTGTVPSVEIETSTQAIGKRISFQIKVSESRRGLTFVKAELVQGDKSAILAEKGYRVSSQFYPWGRKTVTDTFTGTGGVRQLPELREGSATIRVTAGRASTWLLHPDPEIREISLPVRLTPPALEVTSTHTYVSQGGCELVTYRVGANTERDGVRSGSWWFPGYPLPGGEGASATQSARE